MMEMNQEFSPEQQIVLIAEDVADVKRMVTELESGSDYTAPAGCTLVAATDAAQIGGTWTGTAFQPAPAPTPGLIELKRTRLAELKAKGWPNLTTAEKTEAQQLVFELIP